jgi:hypothetical protein
MALGLSSFIVSATAIIPKNSLSVAKNIGIAIGAGTDVAIDAAE